MEIKPTKDDIKKSAILFQYGENTGGQKSITDEHINSLIDDVYAQVAQWLNQNNIPIPKTDNDLAAYNVKRLIVLEVIINIALSYYNNRSAEDDYIGSLKKERDYYRDLLKENIRRLSGSNLSSKIPRLKNGQVFGGSFNE